MYIGLYRQTMRIMIMRSDDADDDDGDDDEEDDDDDHDDDDDDDNNHVFASGPFQRRSCISVEA